MDYVVTLVGGNSYVIPDTAINSQHAVHGPNIASIRPVIAEAPVSVAELPSAVETVDFDKMKLKELKEYCIEKQIPPSVWNSVTNVMKLRKILKEYNV